MGSSRFKRGDTYYGINDDDDISFLDCDGDDALRVTFKIKEIKINNELNKIVKMDVFVSYIKEFYFCSSQNQKQNLHFEIETQIIENKMSGLSEESVENVNIEINFKTILKKIPAIKKLKIKMLIDMIENLDTYKQNLIAY
jgi:hypothetical protein